MKKIEKAGIAAAIIVLALAITSCGAKTETQAPGDDGESAKPIAEAVKITQEEAKARMDSGDPLVILDVRTEDEYADSHIPGAILIPNEDIDKTNPKLLPATDTEILVYCRSGRRSAEAADKLAAMGYINVKDFGGINDWTYEKETSPWETKRAKMSSFRASTIEGKIVDESVFKNYKVTMINVWATFCGPCLNEMPDLGAISEEYKDKGFQIIGIAFDTLDGGKYPNQGIIEQTRSLATQTGAGYMHLIPSPDLMDAWLSNVKVVPTTYFVDAEGRIIGKTYTGSKSKEKWEEIINDLL